MRAKGTHILKIIIIIIGTAVLTSYSGQWEVFTGKNDVRDIALSGTTLWAATTGGVVKWNLVDNSNKSYTTLDGLLSCSINQVAIDKKGRVWVATKDPNGLFIYENHAWKQMNVGGFDNEIKYHPISGLEVDQFGNVWVYIKNTLIMRNSKYSLWRYNGQTWHKHEGVYGPLALDLHKNLLAVDTILADCNPSCDTRFRIVSFNGSEFIDTWRSRVRHNSSDLVHIAQDSKGNAWFSCLIEKESETYGVVRNDTVYNTLDGLADDNIRGITTDESGNVWCATDGGISKFNGEGWVTYDTTRGVASNLVYKILIGSDNTLYAATSKGISILKSNRFKTLKTINDPSHNNYTDMVIDKRDAVMLSGNDHITIYNDLQWKLIYYPKISFFGDFRNTKSFIKSKDGTLYAIGNEIIGNKMRKGWIMKQGADENTFVKVFSYSLKKKYNLVRSPAVAGSGDDPCFWLADLHDNLILISKQRTEVFPLSRFGAGDCWISCILLDRDERSVWVGFYFTEEGSPGIIHFDGDTVKKRIYERDGLPSNCMNDIARDSSENLWFASGGGVSVLRNGKLTAYSRDIDGNYFGDCKALFVDNSGMVWTLSRNGIARFDGRVWKLFDRAALSSYNPYFRCSHIIQDRSGTVWFGTEDGFDNSGLLAYKDNRWYQFATRDGLPSNNVRRLALDSKDNLWILTDHGIAMCKSDETGHTQVRGDFVNPEEKRMIKQRGSRFYVSSKDKPGKTRYTLFDLRGRVVLSQTIQSRKSFVLPESSIDFGSSLRILSITTEDINGFQNKYYLKKEVLSK